MPVSIEKYKLFKVMALITLSTLVSVSNQQYHRSRDYWTPPLVIQRIYDNRPAYDYDIHPYFRNSQPPKSIYNQANLPNYQNVKPSLLNFDIDEDDQQFEDEFEDIQSRVKGAMTKYRPSYVKQDPRIFLNLISASSFTNPFLRTATFTITSTINITSVQSCISANSFSGTAAQNANCRRKRDTPLLHSDADDAQFSIEPTQALKIVEATALPAESEITSNYERIPRDYWLNPEILSTKEDKTLRSDDNNARYLLYAVAKTVTSYTFVSTTITKVVNIVSATSLLQCKPAGYVICT